MTTCWLAINVARKPSAAARVYGGTILFFFGWLLTFEAVGRASEPFLGVYNRSLRPIVLAATAIWIVLFALLMVYADRASRPPVQARHGRRC